MYEDPNRPADGIQSTCMKWSADGTLSPRDQDGLMKHLCATDPALVDSEACKLYQNDS